ncbi:MAG: hypothetical protein HND44_24455 [Chloroflexi bacterium]|nr:hypothetical protein [Ardenticatenaceae bacterium]MBL1131577.1 hypothetical protein [Chloroflexota bacterium]NOG37688.1 hypothetical protein [Chloroflexota bacterium]
MALREAIRAYHDLLTEELAAESQGQLTEQMQMRGLFFGNRPLCTVLRPRFVLPDQYTFLRKAIRPLLGAFDKISELAVQDAAFRKQFGLVDWEEELIRHDPGYRGHTPLTRLDAFFVTDTGELKFTEYNAEVPAASAYSDVLTEVFYGLPVMGMFMREYVVRPLPTRHSVLHVLMRAYRQWGGAGKPNIAILDWKEVPTYSEFELFMHYFRSQGVTCEIVDPREVEYRNGRLIHGDYHIDLIYKRVLITELIERGGLDQPVVNAVRDGAVCMVNPWRCKMLYKKMSLAVLSDEQNAHLFDEVETAAIRAHIPWTRTVEERKTSYGGLPIDLIPFIHKYKDQLVLKPNDDYGGHGIVLGWQTNASGWETAVQEALQTPYIVQERVAIPTEPYPSLLEGGLHIYDRMLDTAPFIFHGSYVDGCLTRLSTDPLLNVSAGGGSTVPTFVVEKR